MIETMSIVRFIKADSFALSFAAAQHYADQAKHDEILRPFAIQQVREELQSIFEMLPQNLQMKILEVQAQLKVSPSRPEVRNVQHDD